MKIAITSGSFDCLGHKEAHLIKEMRKAVLPDGQLCAILFDDYPVFCMTGKFPVQSYHQREKNLRFLVPEITVAHFTPIGSYLSSEILRYKNKKGVERIIYFGFQGQEDFPGVEEVNAYKIPKKFIKLPKEYEQKTENN